MESRHACFSSGRKTTRILLQSHLEGNLVEVTKLMAVAVWLRLSAMRLLTWNRNYNIKPREISAAQVSDPPPPSPCSPRYDYECRPFNDR